MRREILSVVVLLNVISGLAVYFEWFHWIWLVFPLTLLGIAIHDVGQKRHALLRNFPIIAHLRYLLEMIRPEIQQYFIESDTSDDPIARFYRDVVYRKAKGDLETVPFGSELDFYAHDYQWVNHSSFPVDVEESDFRVTIGGPDCLKPYSASIFNVSAMSYGSISQAAIEALGRGAKEGGFSLNTGEGGLTPHHLNSGADLVWQLGTAYFGARDQHGYFAPEAFREKSRHPHVKMIEIKISQGAKPGHGGILPGDKVNAEVASIRQVEIGKTVFSPAGHTAFTTPTELCEFIQKLRELSDGKPIGFKLCIGRREEFLKICEAMVATKITPDFITVDGGEGGTGAAPFDFINYVGSPLKEGLYFVNCTLTSFGLRDRIKIIASGKVFTAFNLFEKLALGADLCNSARGMMLALGCIQAYRCNTNKCPTGIATTDPKLTVGLNVEDKFQRVANYHRRTMVAMADLIGAAGLHSPLEVDLHHISRRFNGKIRTLDELFAGTSELSSHEERERHGRTQGEPRAPTPPR
jgi:glutamate synthase domain-containing protein 2